MLHFQKFPNRYCRCWSLATAGIAETEQVSSQALNGPGQGSCLVPERKCSGGSAIPGCQVKNDHYNDHSSRLGVGILAARSIVPRSLPLWSSGLES